MLAIGNNELGEPAGDTITCPFCEGEHLIEFGTSRRVLEDGTLSEPEVSTLGFYKCGDSSYLASINGMLLK